MTLDGTPTLLKASRAPTTRVGLFLVAGFALLFAACAGGVSEDSLEPGDCVSASGNTAALSGNTRFDLIDCDTARGFVLQVVWNQDAVGTWPAAVDQLAAQCGGTRAQAVVPSKDAWDQNDRNVICFESRLMNN